MTQILDGKIVRDKIAEDLKAEVAKLDPKPKLVIIQVGDLAESNTYIKQKVLFGEKIGCIVEHKKLPQDISQEDLISQLSILQSKTYPFNSQLDTHGIIVQMPIPNSLDKDKIIESIDPKKDVDGLTSTNVKLLFERSPSRHPDPALAGEGSQPKRDSSPSAQNDNFTGYIPATTKGILTILDHYKIPVRGKKVTIVGRSSLVGKPTALAMLNLDATVTIAHSKTQNLADVTKNADILVVAVGKPNLITKNHVSKDQIVIDVGINVLTRSDLVKPKLVGDVDFEEVEPIVKAITPVPGGCGPMTVASLFQNLLEAYQNQQ